MFDNLRVLHGRSGFEGSRLLEGCYFNWDFIKSKVRTLRPHMRNLDQISIWNFHLYSNLNCSYKRMKVSIWVNKSSKLDSNKWWFLTGRLINFIDSMIDNSAWIGDHRSLLDYISYRWALRKVCAVICDCEMWKPLVNLRIVSHLTPWWPAFCSGLFVVVLTTLLMERRN